MYTYIYIYIYIHDYIYIYTQIYTQIYTYMCACICLCVYLKMGKVEKTSSHPILHFHTSQDIARPFSAGASFVSPDHDLCGCKCCWDWSDVLYCFVVSIYPPVNWHRPWQIGVGRWVSTKNEWFSGSMLIFQMVYEFGGFHKWRNPHNWMVYNGKTHYSMGSRSEPLRISQPSNRW